MIPQFQPDLQRLRVLRNQYERLTGRLGSTYESLDFPESGWREPTDGRIEGGYVS